MYYEYYCGRWYIYNIKKIKIIRKKKKKEEKRRKKKKRKVGKLTLTLRWKLFQPYNIFNTINIL